MLVCGHCGKPILNLQTQMVTLLYGNSFCRCHSARTYFRVNVITGSGEQALTPEPQAFHDAFNEDDLDPGGEQHAIL